MCASLLRHVQPFATPWIVACQAPLSMQILKARIQEWAAIFFPRYLPQGSDPMSPALSGWFFTTEPPGKPSSGIPGHYLITCLQKDRRRYSHTAWVRALDHRMVVAGGLPPMVGPQMRKLFSVSEGGLFMEPGVPWAEWTCRPFFPTLPLASIEESSVIVESGHRPNLYSGRLQSLGCSNDPHRPGLLVNNGNGFFSQPEAGKFKIKEPQDLVSGGAFCSLSPYLGERARELSRISSL